MSIKKEEIEKLAQLVRLELSEEEKNKYSSEIASILEYVKKLDEVDTENIELDGEELLNVLREDISEPSKLSRDELLKNAPMTENGFIKVKSVME